MKLKLFLFFSLAATLAFALDPAKITMTNVRAEAVSPATSETFYRGDRVNFTNCVAFSGTTNSVRQDLTGLTILVTLGDATATSLTITGTVATATAGVWNASATLRTNSPAKTYIQLRLTNTTDDFSYPFKYVDTKEKL